MIEFGPAEIHRILSVTDSLGLHRESVRIPLWNEGAGAARVVGSKLEIVAPGEGDFEMWFSELPKRLRELDLSRVRRA